MALAYILSLERSGSTPLSFLLARYPGVVSMGEIERTLRYMIRPEGVTDRPCSCGAGVEDCPIWGPLHAQRDALPGLTLPERYRLVFDVVERHAGPDALVIDSSKSIDVLSPLADSFGHKLKVLFLVKDVRNYLESIQRRASQLPADWLLPRRFQGKMVGQLWRKMPMAPRYLHRWWRHNRAMDQFISSRGIPSLRFGYDELFLDRTGVVSTIEGFLGLSKSLNHREPPGHHVLLGNFSFLNDPSRHDLVYDPRWFWSNDVSLFDTLLMAPLMRMNRAFVYGNTNHPT